MGRHDLTFLRIFTKIHVFFSFIFIDPKFFIVLPVKLKIKLMWPY